MVEAMNDELEGTIYPLLKIWAKAIDDCGNFQGGFWYIYFF